MEQIILYIIEIQYDNIDYLYWRYRRREEPFSSEANNWGRYVQNQTEVIIVNTQSSLKWIVVYMALNMNIVSQPCIMYGMFSRPKQSARGLFRCYLTLLGW